jgi:hypothetical protein
MSFCDPDRPTGEQFLGCLIIRAADYHEMIIKSHLLGLNPGGEVQFIEIPKKMVPHLPTEWVDKKLISRQEAEELDDRLASQ